MVSFSYRLFSQCLSIYYFSPNIILYYYCIIHCFLRCEIANFSESLFSMFNLSYFSGCLNLSPLTISVCWYCYAGDGQLIYQTVNYYQHSYSNYVVAIYTEFIYRCNLNNRRFRGMGNSILLTQLTYTVILLATLIIFSISIGPYYIH